MSIAEWVQAKSCCEKTGRRCLEILGFFVDRRFLVYFADDLNDGCSAIENRGPNLVKGSKVDFWAQLSRWYFRSKMGKRGRKVRSLISNQPCAVSIERLEKRIALTNVTAYEEYFLALINRARQDPVAEATRLGTTLNEGLPAGTLAPGARQPLALNDNLQAAIEGHIADELANNYFSHTGSDGSTPVQRINASGYTGWTRVGENLALQYTSGAINLLQFVTDEYQNLFIDTSEPGRGHRVNMVDGTFSEVGSAVQSGTYTGFNAVDTGNDFGTRPGNSFLTGIAYTDSVSANNFYDVGEGLGGVSIDITGAGTYHTTANSAGGYQIALPAGSYTVTFSGTGISSPIIKNFTIGSQNVEVDANTRTNVPPVLYSIESTPLSAIGALSTPVTSTLAVYDKNLNNWTSATISITSNYQSNQDVLTFTNTANITGSWNSTTGTLTVTGTDTVSNYRVALRNVMYHNTSASPNMAVARTISFQANNGQQLSNIVTRSLIDRTGASPAISGFSAPLTYVLKSAPLTIAPSLVVTHPDSLNIASATVTFVNWQGGDRLDFSNTFALQHTFTEDLVAKTAVLTLTGTETVAHYQTELRSVIFWCLAGNPVTWLPQVATFTVTDILSHSASGTQSIRINPVANSAPPVVSGVGSTVTYFQGSAPLTVAPNVVVSQPSGLNIYSATVSFANWQDGDRLDFYNSYAFQHTFVEDLVGHTAVLTLTGFETAAHYQTVLRSIVFYAVAGTVNPVTRVATFTVNDIYANSGSGTQNVSVSGIDAPPLVQVNDSTALTYKANNSAIAIFGNALVSDPDSNNLTSLTVQITSGYQNNSSGHDLLSFTNAYGIVGSFNAATGTLTFTGTSYVGYYREVLRLVTFSTSGSAVSTATRSFTVIATDDFVPTSMSSIPVTRNVTVTP